MTQTLEQPRTWDAVREYLNRGVTERGEWAGAPMPVSHLKLVIEPRYPYALNGMGGEDKPALPKDAGGYELLNEWFSHHRNCTVFVCRESDGKSRVYTYPEGSGRRLTYLMNTLGVAAHSVWSTKAESKAIEKLESLVTPQAMRCYTLFGAFLETSKRSGVTYLFRKLRPTLALRPDSDGDMHALAALCMHPIGYYEESFAGVMVPTDDVIAHLVLMRGDEHRFWKKANHHSLWMASSGV